MAKKGKKKPAKKASKRKPLAKKKPATRRKSAQSKKRSSIKIIEKKSRSVKKKTSKKPASKRSTRHKQNTNLRRGGPGRPKGSKNKVTKEIRAIARELLEDEKVQKNLLSRLRRGKADKIMWKLYDYGYGVPKQPVQIEGPDGSDPFATVLEDYWRIRSGESSASK